MMGFKKHSKEIKKSSFPYKIISTGEEKTVSMDTSVVNTMNADKIEIREQASDEIKVLLATIIAYNLKLSNSNVISADEILKSAYPKLDGA